jgi:hypothetical protein
MLTEPLRRQAVRSMDRLMSHPIVTWFSSSGLFGVAPPRMTLTAIRARLWSDSYERVQDWFDDVDSVWAHYFSYSRPGAGDNTDLGAIRGVIGIASDEGRRIFSKEKARFGPPAVKGWCDEVYRLRTSLTEMLAQPDGKGKLPAPSVATLRTAKRASAVMTDRELHRFIQIGTEVLSGEQDQREMIRILTTEQPELESGKMEIHVDVTKLPEKTILALKNYMKSALERQGKKYPE